MGPGDNSNDNTIDLSGGFADIDNCDTWGDYSDHGQSV